MNSALACLVLALGSPLLCSPAFATDLFVPGSFATIQDAIDNAVDGDRIIVAPGTYSEFLNFQSKSITLEGTDPSDPAVVTATIIDGGNDQLLPGFPQNPGTGLLITGALGTVEVRGLTVQRFGDENGFTSALEGTSNGLLVLDRCVFRDNVGIGGTTGGAFLQGTVQVLDCTFERNVGDGGYGGGMALDGGLFVARGCRFFQNRASGGAGGGFAVLSSAQVLVEDCVFEANESNGAGIYVSSFSDVDIIACDFIDNVANGGTGAGIYVDNAAAEIRGCNFTGNTAFGGSGGALNVRSGSFVIVDSCDIRSNTTSGGSGAGITVLDNATVQIVDTVFFGNAAPGGSGTALNLEDTSQTTLTRTTIAGGIGSAVAIGLRDSATLVGTSTIVWNHTTTFGITGFATASFTYSNLQVAQPGVGNISLAPAFRNLAMGDLRLLAISPSIDAGDPLDQPASVDRFGDSRILDGNLDLVMRVDQGYDEYAPTRLSVSGTFTAGGTININWTGAPATYFLGYLVYGLTPSAIVIDPIGVILVDPFIGVVRDWPAAPSNTAVLLPLTLTPGPTILMQAIGVSFTGLTCTNVASFTLQ